ncbi:hypothetical protein [Pseudomarimonas arenosa]|uniref:Uncharacterized protein n=1 Tax=Pseudomarimonas arenosa TaxID=2774145 RepID=A0AAW3ZN10_9GAMM|nr:hypothetical protein [Pseudomarimonas arenosa]MBD8525761.1 hypothetical protein [Pseudomarimonas arenosa]
MRPRSLSNASLLMLAVVGGAAIWALSPRLIGFAEPWDSDSMYYLLALAVLGSLLGALARGYGSLLVIAFGVLLGQVLHVLSFGQIGALWMLGLVLLVAYLPPVLLAAAVSLAIRRRGWRRPKDGPAG